MGKYNVGTDSCTFAWKPSCLFSILLNVSERGMAVSLGKKSMEKFTGCRKDSKVEKVKYQIELVTKVM